VSLGLSAGTSRRSALAESGQATNRGKLFLHFRRDGRFVGITLKHMAKPDMPNFTVGGRIIFGLIAVIVIVSLLYFFGFF
jgi:hypothetical protein